MALTKIDIVEIISSNTDISKQDCVKLVESLFEIIKNELAKGNEILFSGFGKWSVKEKKARLGRNPKTGEKMIIDARRVVTFKSAEKLRSEINHDSQSSKGG